MTLSLENYLKLPYTKLIHKDEDGDFVVRIEELPGCATHGKDAAEALARLEEAMELWISDALERGYSVPLPKQMAQT